MVAISGWTVSACAAMLGLLAATQASARAVTCETVGSLTFCDDGRVFQHFGDVTFGSDGTVYQRFGDLTFDNRRHVWQRAGDVIFGSDGSTCQQAGGQVICGGRRAADPIPPVILPDPNASSGSAARPPGR